mgnify:CR=1 FL=1
MFLRSKASGVVAGLEVALRVFTILDPEMKINCHFKDGDAELFFLCVSALHNFFKDYVSHSHQRFCFHIFRGYSIAAVIELLQ